MTATERLSDRLTALARLPVLAGGERRCIEVVAPFTGRPLGRIPHGTPDDVREAVRRARAAQPAWAALPVAERARVFLRFHDLLLERQAEVLDLIQLEAGKTRLHAFEEMADTALVSRYYACHAARHLRSRRRRGLVPGLTEVWEHHQPVGVVGCVVPWNYPLNLGITDSTAALMAGNAVVLKPDHQTSFSSLWAVELLHQCGLPADVLPVVTGPGPELGPTLVGAVDFVVFTGSTATGKVIARQAAERLIGVSLELGGKNPMLVLEDADLEAAVDGALRGSFVGAGQVCVSTERILVHRSLHDRFVARLAERTSALRLGPALDFSADVGSLTSVRQLERVRAHVDDAVAGGAVVRAGGRARPELGPLFFEPTVLTGVRPGMLAYAEETFGPVVSVYSFATEDEAVQRANDSRYGLSASVWTRSPRRGLRVAARLRAGMVNVNEAYSAAWGSVDAPIGGFKESGVGRRHGAAGILKYTETQTVAVQRGPALAPSGWMGAEAFTRAMTGMLRLVRHLPGLR